ncbi:MAG: hypothetical protein CEO19_31 [Parcubacteria group bacterium Gr01-1014_73]|nr:MAG: hypothetical protein CEO19_31 [Parcubacteria group bacterium Gr01-1014_73]
MINFLSNKNKNKGTSLPELLIYVAILALILVTLINMILVIGKSYGRLKSSRAIETVGEVALEQMTREIRKATAVNAASVLGVSPGKLILDTMEFSLIGEAIYQRLNGGAYNPLTASSTAITSLIFRELSNGRTKAVKVELTAQSGEGVAFRSEKFYTTVVLRGSYQNQ